MESKRLKALKTMDNRYPWDKKLKQMSDKEKAMVDTFIIENDHLSKSEFELLVNRLFLDKKDKPKNWTLITEILVNCNVHHEK
jgi:hypothetical protein